MLARLGSIIARFFRAVMPDPFVLAVLLTLVTFVLALVYTSASPREVLSTWAGPNGIWTTGLLAFALQMCLILVTGHALASAPLMARMLRGVARWPNSARQAVAMVAFVAAFLGMVNWGLGLIAGAILARETGRAMQIKGVRVHYPLLAAAGYVGMMVWHGGLSGSAPLSMSNDNEVAKVFGANSGTAAIPLELTLFSPMNLVITVGLLFLAPAVLSLMSPRAEQSQSADLYPSGFEDDVVTHAPRDPGKPLLPRLLEDTPLVTSLLLGALVLWGGTLLAPDLMHRLTGGAFGVDEGRSRLTRIGLNEVILIFLALGLVLHATPRRYMTAVQEASGACGGIILQFPLYFGILGVMQLGLIDVMARSMADFAGRDGLTVCTFLAACVINLFVPSGGGQWAIQGPIALQSAREAGVPLEKMVMAVAYGDQLTNMLQPFWALPLLAITGVKAREIVGYTAVLMVIAGIWIAGWLLVF